MTTVVESKYSCTRDATISRNFSLLKDDEIERLFRTAGGLYATQCFTDRKPASVISERSDRWILEVRPATGGGNNAWIKSTSKCVSDLERTWVLYWLEELGFDQVEAIIYFNSNIPRKRDIAEAVGSVLESRRQGLPDGARVHFAAIAAANQVGASIDTLVSALRRSGRLSL